MIYRILVFLMLSGMACVQMPEGKHMMTIEEDTITKTVRQLIDTHGESQRARIEQGVRQAAVQWKSKDGGQAQFTEFCSSNFLGDPQARLKTLKRFDTNLESLYGHLTEIERDFLEPMHLDIGPMLPVDYLFADYSVFAHVDDDLFKNKIAFSALLNYPLATLDTRLKEGQNWSRAEWAAARLTEQFAARVPAETQQRLNEAYVRADDYISNYNIHMHHLLDENGERPFPEGLKLITHWGLRDELKGRYADPDGLRKQQMIQTVMERIIRQEIPAAVIDNPGVDWNPAENSVLPAAVQDGSGVAAVAAPSAEREADVRYQQLLKIFRAERGLDPYYPTLSTKIKRRFEKDREIPEAKVEALFTGILTSEEIKQTARLIEKRLGRPLQPFDIWYNGFKARGTVSESILDGIVAKKYPEIEAFQKDIPEILRTLGFKKDEAEFLGTKIIIDPARGSGHAMGAARREDNAHLRTRFAPGKPMTYKGYNIALHELGHNVEQVLSLNKIDWVLLQGVPNTAFTEAFAFVFQARDLDVLGVTRKDPAEEQMRVLDMLWSAFEISAVSLVDMRVWHWMYDHPDADAGALREAVIQISLEVWNEYMAPVIGVNGQILLGVYSHMIDAGLYLPDYPLGFLIAWQIEDYLKDKNLGEEMARMCALGAITPDAWMQAAVQAPVSIDPLLKAAGRALSSIGDQ